jgi:triacylglycerol lipase
MHASRGGARGNQEGEIMTKPIPSPLPHVVYPPIPEMVHPYLQEPSRHPFRHGATAFEPVNAWWLAEAALLAYAGQKLAHEAFAKAGLTLAGDQPFHGASTECYVAHCDDFVIVAFRGTQVFKPSAHGNLTALLAALRDVTTDARFCLEEVEGGGCVHSGFKSALDEIWNPLAARLQQLAKERPKRPVWFTGHSLGAALATLAASRYPGARELYTFGSPLVGDADFVRRLKVPAYRFVNNNDVVTRVSPFGVHKDRKTHAAYQHVGTEKYIDSKGRIGQARGLLDAVGGILGNLKDEVNEVIGEHNWLLRQPLDSFNDHGPLYYALHTWNHYEDTR